MNRIVLVAGGVILVGLLLGGAYFVTRNNTSETSPSPNSTQEVNVQNGSFSGTFLDLLGMGQDQMCTFDNTDETGTRTEGTVYIASGGDRLNSNFNVDQPTGSFNGNIVRDGDYTYVWTTLQEQGVKIKITPENESLFGEMAGESDTGISDETEVDFNCTPWTVDESKFVVPSNIEFVDVSEALEQFQDMPSENQCAACSQLPEGDVRNQCLSALKCE